MELQQLQKWYPQGEGLVKALDGVNLTVETGEFVTIIGPSGSGKSTLMNQLGCLDQPTGGRYLLEGEDVAALDEAQLSRIRRRTIGFVFQGFHLLPGLTALENVELPLYYQRIPPLERRRLALEALDRVGLAQRADHLPAQMSGGQQQRTAIARAIAPRPPLILADEPTGNLDREAGQQVMALLRELWQEGRTLILITHDPDIAAQAPRTVVIRDGKVVEEVRREQMSYGQAKSG